MPLIFFICLYFVTLIGVIGIVRFKYLSPALRFVVWYVVCAAFSGWIEHILGSFFHVHTLWLFHFNTFIELGLLLLAFYYWRDSELNGKLMLWSFYFYVIVWVVGMFTFEPLSKSDDYSGSIAQLIKMSFSVWLLITVLKDNNNIWKNDPRFWVTSGIIIYISCTFLLFGLFNTTLALSSSMLRIMLYINWYAIIISYSFFLRAFFCKPANSGAINQSQTI